MWQFKEYSMKMLLLVGRIAVVLGAMGLLSGSVFAGPEEIEQALSRAVRSPSAASLAEAQEEVTKSFPDLLARTIRDGTPVHKHIISETDRRKSFLQLRKSGLKPLPIGFFVEERESAAASVVASATPNGIVLENFVVKPVLRKGLVGAWALLGVQLQFSLQQDEWGEDLRRIIVDFTLSIPDVLAAGRMILEESFFLEDIRRAMADIVIGYPNVLVDHVFEVHPLECAVVAAEQCRALGEDNARLKKNVEDLTRQLRERERQHERVLALRIQEKREIATQALGMLEFLRKLYYNVELSAQEVDEFMRFFTHRQYTQEQYGRVGYDRIVGQARAFLEFSAGKHRLEARVVALKAEVRTLRAALEKKQIYVPKGHSLEAGPIIPCKDAA